QETQGQQRPPLANPSSPRGLRDSRGFLHPHGRRGGPEARKRDSPSRTAAVHARTPFGCGPSTDAMEISRLRTVIAGQFAQGPAVSRRAHDLEEGLDPRIGLPAFGEAEIIGLLADTQEVQASLLADEAEADPRIRPPTTDGLSNPPMAGRQPPGGPSIPQD